MIRKKKKAKTKICKEYSAIVFKNFKFQLQK